MPFVEKVVNGSSHQVCIWPPDIHLDVQSSQMFHYWGRCILSGGEDSPLLEAISGYVYCRQTYSSVQIIDNFVLALLSDFRVRIKRVAFGIRRFVDSVLISAATEIHELCSYDGAQVLGLTSSENKLFVLRDRRGIELEV